MSEHNHKHDASGPFSDIHCSEHPEEGTIRIGATLAIDPDLEGLFTGIGVDASASMKEEFGRGGFLFNRPDNLVNDALQQVLPYLIGKDASRSTWAAWWATGDGTGVVPVAASELTVDSVRGMKFEGPRDLGGSTHVVPLLEAFDAAVVTAMRAGQTVEKVILVILTDGQWHDIDQALDLTQKLAKAILDGKRPKMVFSVVGIGDQVDENQLVRLMHDTYDGEEHEIWCYNVAAEMTVTGEQNDLPRIVAHLVDSKIVAYKNGAEVVDDKGNRVAFWEADVPAHFEFEMPASSSSFTLILNGKKYTVDVEDVEHEGEHHDDDEHEPVGHSSHH